jgi:hypothetical protein
MFIFTTTVPYLGLNCAVQIKSFEEEEIIVKSVLFNQGYINAKMIQQMLETSTCIRVI